MRFLAVLLTLAAVAVAAPIEAPEAALEERSSAACISGTYPIFVN